MALASAAGFEQHVSCCKCKLHFISMALEIIPVTSLDATDFGNSDRQLGRSESGKEQLFG